MEPLTTAERLAALLDGRLDARERVALLAEVERGGDEREILAESAAVTAELEAEDRAAGAIPLASASPRRPAPRWTAARWGAIAAAVAVLALAPVLWRTLHRDRAPGDVVALLSAPSRPLGDAGPAPLSDLRGVAGSTPSRSQAVRFGAIAADLEIAMRSNDRAAISVHARKAAVLLQQAGGTAAAYARTYRALSDSPEARADPAEVRRAATGAARSLGRETVEFGAWAETARVAAARSDTAFFRSRASRRHLDHGPPGGAGGAGAMAEVRAAIDGRRVPDFAAAKEHLTDLLAKLGR